MGRRAIEISAPLKAGKLTVCLDPNDPEHVLELDVGLGYLCPVDETRGLQSRLRNLGYDVGELDGDRGPKTERGLEAFRRCLESSEHDMPDFPDEHSLERHYGA